MILEAEAGEMKADFFERVFDGNESHTYVFNGVKLQVSRGTTTAMLAARLHDAICEIARLNSYYRR